MFGATGQHATADRSPSGHEDRLPARARSAELLDPLASGVVPVPPSERSGAARREYSLAADAPRPLPPAPVAAAAVLALAALAWAQWSVWGDLGHRWWTDPKYSHGFLVVAFALYLAWIRRAKARFASYRPELSGLVLVAAGAALQAVGGIFAFEWLAAASIVPILAGVAVILFGRASLAWLGPPLLFLLFMVPLPATFETVLSEPLRGVAARASKAILLVAGFPATRDGNVIRVDRVEVGVAEACSGLAMLMTFLALSAAVAILWRGHWLVRVLVLAAAVPVAVAANILRVSVTAALMATVGERVANVVFHDLAGWLMMPAALAMLWVVVKVGSALLLDQPPDAPSNPEQRPTRAPVRKTARRANANANPNANA